MKPPATLICKKKLQRSLEVLRARGRASLASSSPPSMVSHSAKSDRRAPDCTLNTPRHACPRRPALRRVSLDALICTRVGGIMADLCCCDSDDILNRGKRARQAVRGHRDYTRSVLEERKCLSGSASVRRQELPVGQCAALPWRSPCSRNEVENAGAALLQ